MAVNSLSPWFFRFVPINPCGEVGEIHFSPREQSPAPLMSAPRDCRLTPRLFWRLTRRSSNDPHRPERAVLSPSLHLRQTSFREAGPVPDATQHAGMLAAPVRSVRAVCAGGERKRSPALDGPLGQVGCMVATLRRGSHAAVTRHICWATPTLGVCRLSTLCHLPHRRGLCHGPCLTPTPEKVRRPAGRAAWVARCECRKALLRGFLVGAASGRGDQQHAGPTAGPSTPLDPEQGDPSLLESQ